MTLKVTNRATKAYALEIDLNNGYGDNCVLIQNSSSTNTLWKRRNANLFVIEASIQPNSTLSINWKEVYTSK